MELIDILPTIISLVYIIVVAAGVYVTWKYGSVYAYAAFFWVFPLAAITCLNWGEGPLGFGYSILNPPYVLGTVLGSFVIGVICLPIVILWNWRELSPLKAVVLVVAGIFHASPFLFCFLFAVAISIWGK